MQNEKEKVLYQGAPSQIINFNTFAICIIMLLLAIFMPFLWNNIFIHYFASNKHAYISLAKAMFFIPLFWSMRCWLKVKCHKYKITAERFIEIEGMLTRTTNEIELFRIKDMTLSEPLILRIFNCGNIIMNTSDKSSPVVVMCAIKNAKPVLDTLRKNVALMRASKGVREIEM